MKPVKADFFGAGFLRKGRVGAVIFAALSVSILGACSGEKTPPRQEQPQTRQQSRSPEVKWTEILLRPTDSTKQDWIAAKETWPEGFTIHFDSTGRTQVSDLNIAVNFWTFKNLDYRHQPEMSGLRFSLTLAATHVPSHLLMKDFLVDSVLFFLPGQTTPAARRKGFLARRNFLEGVWQIEAIHDGLATADVDFPEGTRVKPRAYISWDGKSIVFDLPFTVYEYVQTPQPRSAAGQ